MCSESAGLICPGEQCSDLKTRIYCPARYSELEGSASTRGEVSGSRVRVAIIWVSLSQGWGLGVEALAHGFTMCLELEGLATPRGGVPGGWAWVRWGTPLSE